MGVENGGWRGVEGGEWRAEGSGLRVKVLGGIV